MHYELNDMFNNNAEQTVDFDEVDCDYVHREDWSACVEGWYRLEASLYEVIPCEGDSRFSVMVSLYCDSPECGWNEICYGSGLTEDEAICDFISMGDKLVGEDWEMFHIALGRYVDKCKDWYDEERAS